jgi:hypothetical protein
MYGAGQGILLMARLMLVVLRVLNHKRDWIEVSTD